MTVTYGEPVSVAVPVYNRAHLIGRSVGSQTSQSYENLDIVLVNDCSTHDIEGAVAAMNDLRVRLRRHDANAGARQRGHTSAMP